MTGVSRNDDLPRGWVRTALEDCCDVILGQSPPGHTYNSDGIGLPFFQGKAEFGDLYPTPEKWCSEPNKISEPGDILISVRAPVGPTNLTPVTSCIGRGLAAIRAQGEIETRYVLYALRNSESDLQANATGSTFSAITGKTLRGHNILLAPLPEQRRIVAEIEKQFTRLDAAVESLKRALAKLKRYRASVLAAACEGRLVPTEAELARQEGRDYEPADVLLERILKERRARWEADELAKLEARGKPPKDDKWKSRYKEPAPPDIRGLPALPDGWVWGSLDQLLFSLRNGISKKPDAEFGTRILRISAVRPNSVDMQDVRYLDEPIEHYADYVLDEGDLLFTRYNGNPQLVGVCGVVPGNPAPTVHPDKLIRGRVASTDRAIPRYLEAVLNVGTSRDYLARRVRTTAGQSGVSGSDLKRMPVPVAPLAEQRRIVEEVERRLSVVEDMERAIEANLQRAERLRQSILKRAFEGRLVPQDPHDEPANVLLERIKAERDQVSRRGQRKLPIS